MFEKATRMKLRFAYKGTLSVEDIWDLSLSDLDVLYKKLKAELKSLGDEEGLITSRKPKEYRVVELKLEIVKRIFDVLKSESEARKDAKERSESVKRIKDLIARKEDMALEAKPVEELIAILESIDTKAEEAAE